jgi:hypothetical protein
MDAATERRRRMQVRIYRTRAEHERDDAAFWAAMGRDERVSLVWTLSQEQWRLRGDRRDESGLCRSVARVQRP